MGKQTLRLVHVRSQYVNVHKEHKLLLRFDRRETLVVREHVLLYGARIEGAVLEIVLLHLRVGLLSGPTVISYAKDRRHLAGAVTSTSAIHVNGPVGGIVNEFQKLVCLNFRGSSMRQQWDVEVLESRYACPV